MKLLFSFLLIILVLASGFSYPAGITRGVKVADNCGMKHHAVKPDACKHDKHGNGTSCTYCVLCVAFIIPVRPRVERDFATRTVSYPDMVQNKLTDYNPACWRPPNA